MGSASSHPSGSASFTSSDNSIFQTLSTSAPSGACSHDPSSESVVSPSPNASDGEFDLEMEDSEDSESSHPDDEPATPISKFSTNATIAQLENGVVRGIQVAEKLDAILSMCPAEIKGSLDLSQAVKSLKSQNTKAEVIIGVIGQTGAGKSSVINSILDEERIVPTNCMRACTAVVTEIAYNRGELPYAAEIDFITADEWKKELEILSQDLEDSDEKSRKSAKSDYAIAEAKTRAVYPTLEDVLESSPDELIQHKSVCNLLGTKISFDDDDPSRFYDNLQSYVDSKKKNRKRNRENGAKSKTESQIYSEPEFWPLIRAVRLYVKAPVLSTGAVIVDLPGTHDSNAARAAVADKYLEKCTGLWIVSPITRAVNDKTAQSLLDESARTQLKLDCGFNGVTFVCSKTDDIRFAEVRDTLDMDAEFSKFSEKLEEIRAKRKSLQNTLKLFQSEKTEIAESFEEINEQIEALEEARDSQADTIPLKREPEGDINERPLQMPRLSGLGNVSNMVTSGQPSGGIGSSPETPGNPTVKDGIGKRLGDARAARKSIKDRREEIASRIRNTTNELENMDTYEGDAEAEFHAQCISRRNEETKATVLEDFALSVKDIDQELAQDDPDFDPDVDLRDYNELAKSLSVFCVSSRAYQILQNRFKGEKFISGFRNAQDTEITELQAHCVKSTEAQRRQNCNQFLNDFNQLLNSLRLWSSTVPRTLTDTESLEFKEELNCKLNELNTSLDNLVEETYSRFMHQLKINILDKFNLACTYAKNKAVKVVSEWNSRSSTNPTGGFHWMVYKAICVRFGVYSNDQGSYNWTKDLTDPLLKIITHGWERFFSTHGPAVFDFFTKKSRKLLESFHKSIERYARKKEITSNSFQTLKQQLETFHGNFTDISSSMTGIMNEKQRAINRAHSEAIEEALKKAYEDCQKEKGRGHYHRMKNIMMTTVEESRHTMFKQATKKIELKLESMALDIKKDMIFRTSHIKEKISSDYQLAVSKLEEEKPSPIELSIKADAFKIVVSAESEFEKLMQPEENVPQMTAGNNGEENEPALEEGEGGAPTAVEQGSDAMEGLETSPAKLKDVKLEKNEEAVLGSECRKETSKEVLTVGLEQGSGTNSGPEKVKVEENMGVVPDSECLEKTSGEALITAAEQSLGANEGPPRVKMEEDMEA